MTEKFSGFRPESLFYKDECGYYLPSNEEKVGVFDVSKCFHVLRRFKDQARVEVLVDKETNKIKVDIETIDNNPEDLLEIEKIFSSERLSLNRSWIDEERISNIFTPNGSKSKTGNEIRTLVFYLDLMKDPKTNKLIEIYLTEAGLNTYWLDKEEGISRVVFRSLFNLPDLTKYGECCFGIGTLPVVFDKITISDLYEDTINRRKESSNLNVEEGEGNNIDEVILYPASEDNEVSRYFSDEFFEWSFFSKSLDLNLLEKSAKINKYRVNEQIIDIPSFANIRVVIFSEDGIWFGVLGILKALGLKNPTIEQIDRDINLKKRTIRATKGEGFQSPWFDTEYFISENDLERLLKNYEEVSSYHDPIKKWLLEVVIPSIKEKGRYDGLIVVDNKTMDRYRSWMIH